MILSPHRISQYLKFKVQYMVGFPVIGVGQHIQFQTDQIYQIYQIGLEGMMNLGNLMTKLVQNL